MQRIKLLGISGSIREGSHTTKALLHALEAAKSTGVETIFLDLKALHLPFCDGSDHYPDFPDVQVLKTAFANADAFLIATPEYHGSLSGVLKNALDLLTKNEVEGKIAAMMAVLAGIHSTSALNTLRVILRQLRMWVVPEQIVLGHAETQFSKQKFPSQEHEARLLEMLQSLISTTHKFKT